MAKNFPKALPDFYLRDVHIKLLKRARRKIKEGIQKYLCTALDAALVDMRMDGRLDLLSPEFRSMRYAKFDLQEFIGRALKRSACLEDWQYDRAIQRTKEDARSDRCKWVRYILENANRVEACEQDAG